LGQQSYFYCVPRREGQQFQQFKIWQAIKKLNYTKFRWSGRKNLPKINRLQVNKNVQAEKLLKKKPKARRKTQGVLVALRMRNFRFLNSLSNAN